MDNFRFVFLLSLPSKILFLKNTLGCIVVPNGFKSKKVKIKAGVTSGPERRRSRKCRAEEQSIIITIIIRAEIRVTLSQKQQYLFT